MSEEEFGPELRIWMLEHFQMMAPDAIWRPARTGLRYRKEGETTLVLENRVDHSDSLHHHERVKRLCGVVEIEVEDENVMLTPVALTAEEAYHREVEERQLIASSWTTDDGTRLMDLDLRFCPPVFLGNREILLDNGETSEIEDWAIKVSSPSGDVMMNPDDYNLIAGYENYMSYHNSNGDIIRAMTRDEMLEAAEAGATGILVGKTCPLTGVKVPPWMWGTYCDINRGVMEE